MTKNELFSAMREHGYSEPEFFSDLEADERQTGTIKQLIQLMDSGESDKAWQKIELLFDEYTYFNEYADDEIVLLTNEAWMPWMQ